MFVILLSPSSEISQVDIIKRQEHQSGTAAVLGVTIKKSAFFCSLPKEYIDVCLKHTLSSEMDSCLTLGM